MKIKATSIKLLCLILLTNIMLIHSGGTDVKAIYNFSDCRCSIQTTSGPAKGISIDPGKEMILKKAWNIGDRNHKTRMALTKKGFFKEHLLYDADWKIYDERGIVFNKKSGENFYHQPIHVKTVDLVIYPLTGRTGCGLRFHPHAGK